MQTEWNKYLTGAEQCKQYQGMLVIFCVCIIAFLWKHPDRKLRKLLVFSAIIGIAVLCPITAIILLKGYTAFYDWLDLQILFPSTLLLALGATICTEKLQKMEIPGLRCGKNAKTILSIGCVCLLLTAGSVFHAWDAEKEAEEHGIPIETAQAFQALSENVPERSLVIAAPRELLMYVRMYEEKWTPLYGRDLWSGKAASYIYSGYTIEYEYFELLEQEQLSEQEQKMLWNLIETGPAECVIVPAGWILDEMVWTECDTLRLTESYTAILKKDLMTNE